MPKDIKTEYPNKKVNDDILNKLRWKSREAGR